jgi:hypothetical protein
LPHPASATECGRDRPKHPVSGDPRPELFFRGECFTGTAKGGRRARQVAGKFSNAFRQGIHVWFIETEHLNAHRSAQEFTGESFQLVGAVEK